MPSTRSSTQPDPRVDGGVAPTAAESHFTDVEHALATLVHANYPPDAPARGLQSDRSMDARASRSFGAAMLGAPDLRPPIPREQRSLGTRGILARVAIALCLTSAIWAWRSYGGPARDIIATWTPPLGLISARPLADQTPAALTHDPTPEQAAAPPAVETSAPPSAQAGSQAASEAASEVASIGQPATTAANEPGAVTAVRQQLETSDLAALRQTVEQLAAGQKQLTREIARLQAEKPDADKPPAEKPHADKPPVEKPHADKPPAEKAQADKPPAEKPDDRMLRHVSAHPAAATAAPARDPTAVTPVPPQAARRVSMASRLSPPPQPAPQMPEPQPSNPPLRPPMPVPQP